MFKQFIKYISITFWKWYLRLEPQAKKKVVGIPYHRDPNDECEFYEPFKRSVYGFQNCQGNGHYLCKKCFHYAPEEEEIEEDIVDKVLSEPSLGLHEEIFLEKLMEESKEVHTLKEEPKVTSWEAKFTNERSTNQMPVYSIYDKEHFIQ